MCDVDFRKFVRFSLSINKMVSMVVVRARSPFGIVSTKGNIVTGFSEKPLLPYYVNAGTYFMRKELKFQLRGKFVEKDIDKPYSGTLRERERLPPTNTQVNDSP